MRLACTAALLCLSIALCAQERNSLLWEISGNGLDQSSYLYGTMHVSKKIAFRLDDVFFEALDNSEIIALESDPDTWLDNEVLQNPDGYGFGYRFDPKGFYMEAFILDPPEIKDLASYLVFDDRLINNILYRTNEYSQNFEEETYLDMFIYQAGSKFGKPVVALENLEESATLVARASMNAMKQKPDEWLQKKMQVQDLNYLMQDAYRERDIDMLDSIDRAMYTDYYRKNMLYIRNENMAQSLDSLLHQGKVFAGIGAAHLPGEYGVIQLLRNQGYAVEPLVSEATDKGKLLKHKFENEVRHTDLQRQGPEDESFSLLLPGKLYPVSENNTTIYVSPDLANGSYISVNRIPTYAFLKEEGNYSLQDIDALLFENIPGEIIRKDFISKNGIHGIDLTNQLKNGDVQRYQIYLRPLEIVIFKMAGDSGQLELFSDRIFGSLEFREMSSKKIELQSVYQDFSIQMPQDHSFTNPSRNGVRMIEGHDPESSSYFFLRKASLNDMKSIEEDEFELRQIQKRFYQDLDLDAVYDQPEGRSLQSQAVFDHEEGQVLHLRTVINRGDYYLLGTLTDRRSEADNFFNSFELHNESYPEEFHQIRDTAMLFTTISPVKPKKFVENSNNYFRRQIKAKPYNPYTKKTKYENKNNEAITVELNKAHDFLAFAHIDSLWSLRKKQYLKKDFKIIREWIRNDHDGFHEIQFIATDTLSQRGILIKNIVKSGLLYELKTVIDTTSPPSKFISEFYENFKPLDTLVGKNFIKDKSADFFAALRDKDSIVFKGYRFPYYNESHIDSLKHYIASFNYDHDTRHIQSHLIQKLGRIAHEDTWDFFADFYQLCYGNSLAQVKILQALSSQRDETSSQLLLDLMSKDLPLVSNGKEISKIFSPYKKDLGLASTLFPELLRYSTVHEYKLEIMTLLAELKKEKLIKASTYKKYIKSMITDARIQLKRHLGRESNYLSQRSGQQFSRKQNSQLLEQYAILLYPYKREKDAQQFFTRLLEVNSPQVRATLASLMAAEDELIPLVFIDSLAGDINSRAIIFNKLEAIDKLHLFPDLYHVQEALAESALFEDRNYVASKDEVIYVGKRSLGYRDKNYAGYYFKIRSKQDFDKNFKMYLVVYESADLVSTEHFYKSDGYRMSDMDSDQSAIDYVTEEFILKDRSRAVVYHPERVLTYSRLGF